MSTLQHPRPLATFLSITFALAAASTATVHAQSKHWTGLGLGTPGCCGIPQLSASTPRYGRTLHLRLSSARPLAPMVFVVGVSRIDVPLFGGILVPNPDLPPFSATTDGAGRASLRLPLPDRCMLPPVPLYAQALVADPQAVGGFAFTQAITATLRVDVDSDFNGDGYADLAVGVPDEHVQGQADAGAVNVMYGTVNGLVSTNNRLIRQGVDLNGVVLGTPDPGDGFGAAIATGDFDGDGFDDLAIGVPREDSVGPARTESGIVQVIYGSAQGLQGGNFGRDDQLFRQGLNGVSDAVEDYDWFGKSVIAGDFDGDGCDDLAIGVPYEDDVEFAQGVIHILWGSDNGLTGQGSRRVHDVHAIEADDRFGWTLATGDYDDDGFADIAVGRPYENVAGLLDAGAVTVLTMGPLGVSSALDVHKNATVAGVAILGTARQYDLFGFSVTSGDFNDDGVDDLAIGVPYEDLNNQTVSAAGSVHVIYGSVGQGLVGLGNQQWSQESPGMLGTAQLSDRFGYSLAGGDFDGDGRDDLAVGVPGERIGGIDVGAAHVLLGSAAGLSAVGNHMWSVQGLGFGLGVADDAFGWSLSTARFNLDCQDDLVFGIPGADVNGTADAGAIAVRYGGPLANQMWSQAPLTGAINAGDRFGAALSGSPDQRPL